MARKIKYYLVAADALPEIFIRVAEAKCMMQTGEADTVGAAMKLPSPHAQAGNYDVRNLFSRATL